MVFFIYIFWSFSEISVGIYIPSLHYRGFCKIKTSVFEFDIDILSIACICRLCGLYKILGLKNVNNIVFGLNLNKKILFYHSSIKRILTKRLYKFIHKKIFQIIPSFIATN